MTKRPKFWIHQRIDEMTSYVRKLANPRHIVYGQECCSKYGCFQETRRVNFAILEDTLRGSAGFSDIDCMAEIDNHFLFIEWKNIKEPICGAQKKILINLKRLYPSRISCFIVYYRGNRDNVCSFGEVPERGDVEIENGDLRTLKDRLEDWSVRVLMVRNAA